MKGPFKFLAFAATCLMSSGAMAGGGLVLRDDACIVQIGFYEAHFTAYQPQTRGNTEFCQVLPDTGDTLFVLDYLHSSMKDVPVDFRIIRDSNSLGRFVRVSDVEAIKDLSAVTVFYRSPQFRSDESLQAEYLFTEGGKFVAVVTAGHPTNNKIYTAVFSFSVAESRFSLWWLLPLVLLPVGYLAWRRLQGTSTGQEM